MTIKIKFKNGKIRAYGDPLEHDRIALAASKLRLQEIEPSFAVRTRNKHRKWVKTVKKFFKCIRFALSKEEPSRYLPAKAAK